MLTLSHYPLVSKEHQWSVIPSTRHNPHCVEKYSGAVNNDIENAWKIYAPRFAISVRFALDPSQ